jgi:hypothetical protein
MPPGKIFLLHHRSAEIVPTMGQPLFARKKQKKSLGVFLACPARG